MEQEEKISLDAICNLTNEKALEYIERIVKFDMLGDLGNELKARTKEAIDNKATLEANFAKELKPDDKFNWKRQICFTLLNAFYGGLSPLTITAEWKSCFPNIVL